MQLNKQIIIILILASLLFSALGAAFYFYNKNKKSIKSKNELVTIYIAKDDIKKNTLLTVNNLMKTKIAKQYLLNKPLLKKEILGKYTKEKIYKNEVFLKQKLNTKIQKSRAKILDFEHSSYNMRFDLFDNPNYSLVQGDVLNIISVFPKEGTEDKKGNYTDFNTQYIAQNIRVLGFMRDGFAESETITKQKIKKIVKKKMIEELLDVKSNEIILDIKPHVLISLINDYNKGNQLWMVKTKESIQIEPLDKMPIVEVKKIQDTVEIVKKDKEEIQNRIKKIVKKIRKPKIYKYKWYKPTNSVVRKSAVIDYSNDEKNEKSSTKSVEIVIDAKKICSEINDKFIIGKVNRFYVRDEGDTKSKKKVLYEKNTIFPYVEKLNYWYKTCDGQFVSKNVVREIPLSYAVKKAGKR